MSLKKIIFVLLKQNERILITDNCFCDEVYQERETEREVLALSLNCDNTHHLWLKRAHPTGTITTKLQWQEKNMLINVTKWNK